MARRRESGAVADRPGVGQGEAGSEPMAAQGAPSLRFTPALRRGRPVSAPFLQPVHFRNPRNRSTP